MACGRCAAKVLKPKRRKLSRDEPVRERRFFEVADAVDAEGDEVSGGGHGAGGLGVGGVGVVEQRRREEGAEEEQEPQAAEDERGVARTGTAGEGGGEDGEVGLCGLGGHRQDSRDQDSGVARRTSAARAGRAMYLVSG